MKDTHRKWDRRFRNEEYPTDPEPSPWLFDCIEAAPGRETETGSAPEAEAETEADTDHHAEGPDADVPGSHVPNADTTGQDGPPRALDVATGTGRNAIPLAEAGFSVEAVDQSRAGLRTARSRARERGVAERIDWIQADVSTMPVPTSRYGLVAISFFRTIDRLPDLKRSLVPGGILFVEHHLRSADDVEFGSSDERFRLASNELLRSCLDLTVLHYEERTEIREDGRKSAIAEIVARKSSGNAQSYPRFDHGGSR
jgi:SAM-dependent methyltransferase